MSLIIRNYRIESALMLDFQVFYSNRILFPISKVRQNVSLMQNQTRYSVEAPNWCVDMDISSVDSESWFR